MATKLEKQEEKFLQYYIMNECDPIGAYINAFGQKGMSDQELRIQTTAMLRRPTVAMRLEEIRKELGDMYAVDKNMITANLVWALHRGREANNIAQVRNSAMDLAKLHGLVVDKSEIDNSHQFQTMRDITIDGSTMDFAVGKKVERGAGSPEQIATVGSNIPPLATTPDTNSLPLNTNSLPLNANRETLTDSKKTLTAKEPQNTTTVKKTDVKKSDQHPFPSKTERRAQTDSNFYAPKKPYPEDFF